MNVIIASKTDFTQDVKNQHLEVNNQGLSQI